jgi:hypothetical protein
MAQQKKKKKVNPKPQPQQDVLPIVEVNDWEYYFMYCFDIIMRDPAAPPVDTALPQAKKMAEALISFLERERGKA